VARERRRGRGGARVWHGRGAGGKRMGGMEREEAVGRGIEEEWWGGERGQ